MSQSKTGEVEKEVEEPHMPVTNDAGVPADRDSAELREGTEAVPSPASPVGTKAIGIPSFNLNFVGQVENDQAAAS